MRVLGIVALGVALCGCAFQRAEIAQDARTQMVGMSKEQVLSCMGAPANKAAEGATEVWGYDSGNGMERRSVRRHRGQLTSLLQDQCGVCRRPGLFNELHRPNWRSPNCRGAVRLRGGRVCEDAAIAQVLISRPRTSEHRSVNLPSPFRGALARAFC